jgi:hypothetical protein
MVDWVGTQATAGFQEPTAITLLEDPEWLAESIAVKVTLKVPAAA